MSTRVQLVQGTEMSELLERDENKQYKIPISGGTVYFFQDGSIVWDSDINDVSSRIVMGRDEILTTSIQNITLTADTWTDVISLDSSVFPDALQELSEGGTYALQIYIVSAIDNATAIQQNSTLYSGIVSWYWGDSNYDGVSIADEILLHRSGKEPYNIYIYAKIQNHNNNSVLSLTSNTSLTIGDSTIKLRKLI